MSGGPFRRAADDGRREIAALEGVALRGGELVSQIVLDEIVLGCGDGIDHLVARGSTPAR